MSTRSRPSPPRLPPTRWRLRLGARARQRAPPRDWPHAAPALAPASLSSSERGPPDFPAERLFCADAPVGLRPRAVGLREPVARPAAAADESGDSVLTGPS